jgi:hypothetical protein
MRLCIVVLVLATVVACGGETLHLGYDDARLADPNPTEAVDLGAARSRCDARATVEEPAPSSPAVEVAAARGLLVGRWLLCAAIVAPKGVPTAIEFAAGGDAYVLHDDGTHRFVRAESIAVSVEWSVRFDAVELVLGDVRVLVTFQRGPMRMFFRTAEEPSSSLAAFVRF